MQETVPRLSARAVPFEVLAPVAVHVEVTGDFTGWVEHGIRLNHHGNGGGRSFLRCSRATTSTGSGSTGNGKIMPKRSDG